MASPAVVNTSSFNDAASTSHAVTLPASIVAGNLLLVFFTTGTAGCTSTIPTGWSALYQDVNITASLFASCFYKTADGTEGATLTITTSGSTKIAANAWQISGWSGTPTVSTVKTGASTTPSSNILSPTGSSADFLFLTIAHVSVFSNTSSYPSSYINGVNAQTSASGDASTTSASRQLTTTSETPGSFTMASTGSWAGFTVGILPAVNFGRFFSMF
jgi:hypothetical protein